MLEAAGRSAGTAGILSGRVTVPVPLKYDICGGSGQEGLRLSIAFRKYLWLSKMDISRVNDRCIL